MSNEEIEKAKCWLSALEVNSEFEAISKEIILQYIEELERKNRKLKVGLDKDKKTCFYEDGHTGRCLGYSFFNDDEPCEYCKSCEALSIKGDD